MAQMKQLAKEQRDKQRRENQAETRLCNMRSLALFLIPVFLIAHAAQAARLEVGQGKTFDSIEKAVAAARLGDEVIVFARPGNQPYAKVAVMVRTPNLSIHGSDASGLVKIDGTGFDYSGVGAVPRAIFQFDPAANHCTLEGFDLTGSHNDSCNGAGVRINAANDVTIRRCVISGNDMGIMSNGQVRDSTGAGQLIEQCLIQKNGNEKRAGYNHNLYLGGASVTVRGCEIAFSLTGHNLKSRAHLNWIEYNWIHDSANRELDLVDDVGNTDIPGSDAVLLGNYIRKAPSMAGNKAVIHFGKDGKADHTGTLWLVHNTIITPYISPVVDLSAPSAGAVFLNNLIKQNSREKGSLVPLKNGVKETAIRGEGNTFTGDFADIPAAVKQGPLIGWDRLGLPWTAFARKPEALLEYVGDNKVQPRKDRVPAAGAGTGIFLEK